MAQYESLEQRNRDNRMALLLATENYIHNEDNIKGVIRKLDMMFKSPNEIEDDYGHQISYWLDKVEIISNVLRMNKLQNHKADAMYLLDIMLKYVSMVKKTIEKKAGEE